MSDNTPRETAHTGTPHPARHPLPPRGAPPRRAAVRTVPRPERHQSPPRGGRWLDARTAEALLADPATEPAGAPRSGHTERLVRLLSAAREVSPALDPDREAAALAAFRDATALRAEGVAAGTGGAHRGRPGTLRGAFAVRRPRVMVAAVASALALGGVAVGMAAARTSPPGGGGSGTSPLVTRPPAAVSPDGGRVDPHTPRPSPTTATPPGTGPGHDHAGQHHGRACGRTANPLCPPAASENGNGAMGENGEGGDNGAGKEGKGHQYGRSSYEDDPGDHSGDSGWTWPGPGPGIGAGTTDGTDGTAGNGGDQGGEGLPTPQSSMDSPPSAPVTKSTSDGQGNSDGQDGVSGQDGPSGQSGLDGKGASNGQGAAPDPASGSGTAGPRAATPAAP